MSNENKTAAAAKREWLRPELKRLEAGAAEANSALTGAGDGIGQQES
jgi:hypothetical protein